MCVVGQRFGYREHAKRLGDPVRPVEVLKKGPPKSHKVRVRWLDGEYADLEEWVPKGRLVVPWDEADGFLDDERHLMALVESSGLGGGGPLPRAVRLALDAQPFGSCGGLGYEREDRVLQIYDFESAAQDLGWMRLTY